MVRKHYIKPICGIYKITCKENGKAYVGLSTDIMSRWQSHSNFAQAKSRWQVIKRALYTHGIDNFTFEILEECPEDMLNEREIFWISHFNTQYPLGYNMTEGGGFGRLSSEAEEKRKASLRGRTFSEEHRKKIGENSKKNIGRKNTDKTKKKMSESRLAYEQTRTEEERQLMSARLSATKKNEPKFVCEHCGKENDRLNHNRWHGDNCKIYKELGVPEKLEPA
jgi:hypothetical protein